MDDDRVVSFTAGLPRYQRGSASELLTPRPFYRRVEVWAVGITLALFLALPTAAFLGSPSNDQLLTGLFATRVSEPGWTEMVETLDRQVGGENVVSVHVSRDGAYATAARPTRLEQWRHDHAKDAWGRTGLAAGDPDPGAATFDVAAVEPGLVQRLTWDGRDFDDDLRSVRLEALGDAVVVTLTRRTDGRDVVTRRTASLRSHP